MLDFVIGLLFVIAFIKGYTDGIIKTIFHFLGWVLGILVSLKFTSIVAHYLQSNHDVNNTYLPFIVFIGLFVIVVFIIRFLATLIEKLLDKIQLNFVNRLAGAILSVGLMLVLASTLLFFFDKVNLIGEYRKRNSWCYKTIEPIGPIVVNIATANTDKAKGLFNEVKEYYDKIPTTVNPN